MPQKGGGGGSLQKLLSFFPFPCSPQLKTQWRIQARGPAPLLFLDQTDVWRVENNFFWDWPPLSQGLDDCPPPPPEGLDLPLWLVPYIVCALVKVIIY